MRLSERKCGVRGGGKFLLALRVVLWREDGVLTGDRLPPPLPNGGFKYHVPRPEQGSDNHERQEHRSDPEATLSSSTTPAQTGPRDNATLQPNPPRHDFRSRAPER